MSTVDERFRVLVEETILIGLPAGAGTTLPPFDITNAGQVLTVSADGAAVEWKAPVLLRETA